MKTFYFINHIDYKNSIAELLFLTSDFKKFEEENKKWLKKYPARYLTVGSYDMEE